MHITILGAGTMGRGIAQVFSRYHFSTLLYDPKPQALKLAAAHFQDNELGISTSTDLAKAVQKADLIIESAPEDLVIKTRLFADIAPFIKKSAVVASNTSTYPLHVLSNGQPFASRMFIMHFFNPADVIPLVELVQSPQNEPGLTKKVIDLLKTCGKVPVVLKKDIRGFIANRLQAAVLREACHLLQEGVATEADIDTVMTQSIGLRWALNGPFEIADYGGLDVWKNVMCNLLSELNNTRHVPEILIEKVNEQHLGLKSGRGFYRYQTNPDPSQIGERAFKLQRLIEQKTLL